MILVLPFCSLPNSPLQKWQSIKDDLILRCLTSNFLLSSISLYRSWETLFAGNNSIDRTREWISWRSLYFTASIVLETEFFSLHRLHRLQQEWWKSLTINLPSGSNGIEAKLKISILLFGYNRIAPPSPFGSITAIIPLFLHCYKSFYPTQPSRFFSIEKGDKPFFLFMKPFEHKQKSTLKINSDKKRKYRLFSCWNEWNRIAQGITLRCKISISSNFTLENLI